MPGPPRKSAHLKILQGTFRPDRDRPPVQATSGQSADKPSSAPPLPPPPAYLSGTAKSKYLDLAAELARRGIAEGLDEGLLVGYCLLYGEIASYSNAIKRRGAWVVTPNGHRQAAPEVALRRAAIRELGKLAQTLGLSPVSRQRLPTGSPPGALRDPLEEFD